MVSVLEESLTFCLMVMEDARIKGIYVKTQVVIRPGVAGAVLQTAL